MLKHYASWASEASPPNGTIFLYASSVSPDTVSCFYAFLFRRRRGEKYRNTMLHSRSPTMLKHVHVRVARYRIASKCFYAFLFRRLGGGKYRNTKNCTLHSGSLPLAHNAEAFIYYGRPYVVLNSVPSIFEHAR